MGARWVLDALALDGVDQLVGHGAGQYCEDGQYYYHDHREDDHDELGDCEVFDVFISGYDGYDDHCEESDHGDREQDLETTTPQPDENPQQREHLREQAQRQPGQEDPAPRPLRPGIRREWKTPLLP